MGRPGLTQHRKFRRLTRALGSAILARGVLEMLWDSCYESGDEYVGTAEDIEHLIGWTGEVGAIAKALDECGQPEGVGFIERMNTSPVTFIAHDLWEHAPAAVYWARSPHARELRRHYNSARRARLRGAEGTLTQEDWAAILKAYKHRCAYCRRALAGSPTKDHVIPLSRGGRHDVTNVVPACLSCNSTKGARTPDEVTSWRG